jgi:hypothetical protein
MPFRRNVDDGSHREINLFNLPEARGRTVDTRKIVSVCGSAWHFAVSGIATEVRRAAAFAHFVRIEFVVERRATRQRCWQVQRFRQQYDA